jgi:hypothetical protein
MKMPNDFSAEYSERSDDELLHLASERHSLTAEATAALDAELRRRNLTESDRLEHQRFVKRHEQREARKAPALHKIVVLGAVQTSAGPGWFDHGRRALGNVAPAGTLSRKVGRNNLHDGSWCRHCPPGQSQNVFPKVRDHEPELGSSSRKCLCLCSCLTTFPYDRQDGAVENLGESCRMGCFLRNVPRFVDLLSDLLAQTPHEWRSFT